MKRNPLLILLLTAMAPLAAIQAATLVEIKDQYSQSKIYAEGNKGRMETGRDETYIIVDGDRVYSVMPERQMVLDMSDSMGQAAPATASGVRAELIGQGPGPEIAGYATNKYGYTANGQSCGTLYTSKSAMKDAGMEHMLTVMRDMAKRAAGHAARFGAMQDPCLEADRQLMGRMEEVGMPLRSLDKNGKVVSEVLRIVKRTTLPPNAFTIPNNYQVRNMAQMQQQAEEQMRSNMPNMEEIMKQMPKDGSMPPGAMEQMQKLKDMMKQYQRQ